MLSILGLLLRFAAGIPLIPPASSTSSGPAPARFPTADPASDSSAVAVRYSATGGSITVGGLFTAGPAEGPFRVIATAVGSGVTDTAELTVGPPPGTGSGIAYGAFDLQRLQFGGLHTGSVLSESPDHILDDLARARSSHTRLIVNFAGGSFRHVQNADGTFSYEKWKARVGRFLPLRDQIAPYVRDGTLEAFLMVDEPHAAASWGGQVIPYLTLERMGEYSKSLWPGLPTTVRVHATWLADAKFRWAGVDAAWSQYSARKGDVAEYLAQNVAAARREGLGLIVGLNVLDGGDGSSGREGTYRGAYNMSPAEIRNYGRVLASDPYVCAFQIWRQDSDYLAQPGVADALSYVAALARLRASAPCRVR